MICFFNKLDSKDSANTNEDAATSNQNDATGNLVDCRLVSSISLHSTRNDSSMHTKLFVDIINLVIVDT